ncbi:MAG: TRAM domain-containing protein, partial [Clostridia bacterium]|nr:TRAM domain-containing protein [Clostridia bacterium]
MEKNKIYECKIENYTAEGMGVARIDGMTVFVPGAAAGDTLKIKIVKVQKNLAYGKIEQIITPSPA